MREITIQILTAVLERDADDLAADSDEYAAFYWEDSFLSETECLGPDGRLKERTGAPPQLEQAAEVDAAWVDTRSC